MTNVLIFHGTEGHPEENWFPWIKKELEKKDYKVHIPQFPSPPVIPAKIDEWFEVLKDYKKHINEETIIIGHSLGGVFLLRLLEKLKYPIKSAFFIGTPVGVLPILNYYRDYSFCGFDFNWDQTINKSKKFTVFQSNNDPYVSLDNGEKLAKKLNVKLNFIPNAGHFNEKAGYLEFWELLEKVE